MRFFLFFYFLLVLGVVHAQLELKVDDTKSVMELVLALEGDGVEISNVTYQSPGGSPVGEFEDVVGLLGLDKGIVMSTGAALDVRGPNNLGSTSTVNDFFVINPDPDLAGVIGDSSLNDQVIIEFDFIAVHNRLSFNYVFGSEEYLEFVNTGYNDVFGFFISGPGISGVENLAVLENGDPVSVNSINDQVNSDKYVNNGDGTSPNSDFYIQLDGYTTRLSAVADVIPCEVYHIKLAIADAGDATYDSGVFIESGSFRSTGEAGVTSYLDDPTYETLIEGCHGGGFEFTRPFPNLSDSVVVYYEMSGVALSGLDYNALTGIAVISIGETALGLPIEAYSDILKEGPESIVLTVVSPCLDSPAVATAQLIIEDEIEYVLDDVVVCPEIEAELNPDFNPERDSLAWAPLSILSCVDCPNPMILPLESGFVSYAYSNIMTGCQVEDSVYVLIDVVTAGFGYFVDDNYTSLDAFFENNSNNAVRYQWYFGDQDSSTEFEPVHIYQTPDVYEPLTFTIDLFAWSSYGCLDHKDTTITIGEPFFVPNIVTPNGDELNDLFMIKGISRGTWACAMYNRWGKRVFLSENYANDFNPIDLATGTYYYELISPLKDKVYKGWVQIVK